MKYKSSKGILRGQPISVYWPQTKNLIWDVLCLTSNQKVTAWRTWAQDCLYQRHMQYHCRSISRLEFDPSVNLTAASYFTTKVNMKSKAVRDKTWQQSQIQWYKLKVVTSKHEDFNLMFTNNGKEDGIYPLKRDSKAQNKDQRSIVTTCKKPMKDLHFQLIENIIVQYKDET